MSSNIGFSLKPFIKMNKIINVSPGPTQLPSSVIKSISKDLDNNHWKHGVTPLEISHRSPEFTNIYSKLHRSVRRFMKIPDEFAILWTQGGGHGQFAAVPLNMSNLMCKKKATYVVSGTWSKRAADEGNKYLHAHRICNYPTSVNELAFTSLPDNITPNKDSIYLYICSNETVNGLEYIEDRNPLPDRNYLNNNKLIVDMSSDFMTKKVNWNKIDVAFACSSKNLGTAGNTITVIRKSLIEELMSSRPSHPIPGILDWLLYEQTDSLYNTPSVFNLYVTEKLINHYECYYDDVLQMEKINKVKSEMIYDILENNPNYKLMVLDKNQQSRMNIPFVVDNMDKFLQYCFENNLVGLRTKTPFDFNNLNMSEPLRISLYNGITLSETEKICDILKSYIP
tara:strand:+ start:2664 stop:3851 length:1188 start_codon:yes stop_codon:yes gene_type:complete